MPTPRYNYNSITRSRRGSTLIEFAAVVVGAGLIVGWMWLWILPRDADFNSDGLARAALALVGRQAARLGAMCSNGTQVAHPELCRKSTIDEPYPAFTTLLQRASLNAGNQPICGFLVELTYDNFCQLGNPTLVMTEGFPTATDCAPFSPIAASSCLGTKINLRATSSGCSHPLENFLGLVFPAHPKVCNLYPLEDASIQPSLNFFPLNAGEGYPP